MKVGRPYAMVKAWCRGGAHLEFYRKALAAWRESRGLPADPMAAYAASGYFEKITGDRVGGTQAGWGA